MQQYSKRQTYRNVQILGTKIRFLNIETEEGMAIGLLLFLFPVCIYMECFEEITLKTKVRTRDP